MKGYFKASPFVDEEGNESWKNYGGVFFDDGYDYDWVEDQIGLTQKEAHDLASILNKKIPNKTFWYLDMDLVNQIIEDFRTHTTKEG